MAGPALSDEDFNRLQNQLIELRTANYELGTKLRKTESDNAGLAEKCNSQEKEIQKLSKIMKFPGFNAITKSKSKKDLAELIEENERLNQQMHRYEDDFKLQNQTLLQEVSRLSTENDELQKQLSTLSSTDKDSSDFRRLQAENTALQNAIQDLKSKTGSDHNDGENIKNKSSEEDFKAMFEQLFSNVQSKIQNFFDTKNTVNKNISADSNSEEDLDVTDAAVNNVEYEQFYTDFKKYLEEQLMESKEMFSYKNSSSLNSELDVDTSIKLETALKETKMLEEKLNSVKEASKVEVEQLRDEVGKWTDKAKKKQESFVKLQEEKEIMYKENLTQQDDLKKSSLKKEEELTMKIKELNDTIDSMKSDSKVDDLLGKVDILRSENHAMQSELSSLKEKHRIDQSEKVKELSTQVEQLNTENSQLKTKVQNLSTEHESIITTTTELRQEIESLRNQLNQSSELAEKRKKLLDQSMVERQHDVESHQQKIEELKQTYENEMQQVVKKNNEELEDLKGQIANHKKLKKELEESKQQVASLQEEIESEQKKSGWLERTLKETEEKFETTKSEKEKELIEIHEKHKQEKEELISLHEQKIKESDDKLLEVEASKQEQTILVEKLTQASKDKEVEYRVANKKTDHLVKDLKRQLNTERKRGDQLQLKLQDFIQEIKVKQTYDEIFNPESLQLKVAAGHKRQDSGSHLSMVSSLSAETEVNTSPTAPYKSSSPVQSSTNLSGLSDETMDLISRYADLQQEKWKLEEKVRHLEENGAVMADDLMQKSLVIQTYVMESKADLHSPQRGNRNLTLKEKIQDKLKLNNSEELNREMNAKMQKMLEETLARNAQLQKDVDLLSKELEKVTGKT